MKAVKINCLCEYRINPVGIDLARPGFLWYLSEPLDEYEGYRIIVSDRPELTEPVWDSGRISEFPKVQAIYNGKKLKSGICYYYRVTVYGDGKCLCSEIQTFVTGILEERLWAENGLHDFRQTGSWMEPEGKAKKRQSGDDTRIHLSEGVALASQQECRGVLKMSDLWDQSWIGGAGLRSHSYLIRWPVTVKKKVKAAAAFAASPNYYRLYLDGRPVSDTRLNNAFTDPSKTLLYATYPLKCCDFSACFLGEAQPFHTETDQEAHVLEIEIGNGWYARERAERGVSKGEHLAAVLMRIEYEDGETEWLHTSPENCCYTERAPRVRNDVYTGETYDARLEVPDRSESREKLEGRQKQEEDPASDLARKQVKGLASGDWHRAFWLDPPGGVLRSQMVEPIRIVEELEPITIWTLEDDSYTVDFGQNFAGWIRLSAMGRTGDVITMRYGELLHEDGSINECSLNGISSIDTYIRKGEETETYEPEFTYHGFRYVQITGLRSRPEKAQIQGCVVCSSVDQIGEFQSDHELLNRYYRAMVWTEKSNLHGIPTDCPQRAERMGWLNDMTVRNESALYLFRLHQFYRKWLGDIRDTQGKITGAIADTAPFFRMGQKPADPVSSCYLMIPWNTYVFYGDKRILEENYEGCRRWVSYLDRHSENGILSYSPMGDWASPVRWCDPTSIGAGSVSRMTPARLMATGFQYYNYCLLEKMAAVLERPEDAAVFREKGVQIRRAFLDVFYQKEEGFFAGNSQASNAFSLYLGMPESGEEQRVLENLLEDIRGEEFHLTTGNLGSKYVLETLFQYGYVDEAFAILTQTTYPSWGYMLENGATTLWERWEKVDSYEGVSKMASRNHPMAGAAGVCLTKYLAGIRPDEAHPGFIHSKIRPSIPKKLSRVSASLETVHGPIKSEWRKESTDTFYMKTVIPTGCSAWVDVPVSWCAGHSYQIRISRGENGTSCGEGTASYGEVRADALGKVMLKEGCFERFRIESGTYIFILKADKTLNQCCLTAQQVR
ncbi:MAG: family 78 glycoside hydrolase catalytic domain [Lachnospiraceae bacterium]|nr:family 78 glycoside hydrolase catalytic domain [Lachnospiraceae bacterium]